MIIELSTPHNGFIACRKTDTQAEGAAGLELFEVTVTFILIAPLMVTLIVLSISLVGAGVRDLISFMGERKKEPEVPSPEAATEAEIDGYIDELKKDRKLRQSA
jgi:hypothetical protein